MTTRYRIAVATSDGRTVDTHFGHADDFTILEVSEDGAFREVERRNAFQACNGECSDGLMEKAAENLKDCEYVLAAKIGPHALSTLSRHGITPLDYVIGIDEAVRKIHAYRQRIKKN